MKRSLVFLPAVVFWVLLCVIPDNHALVLLCGFCAVFLSVGGLHLAEKRSHLS